jgi:aconitate hydratase
MSAASKNSLGARDALNVGGRSYEIYRLDALEKRGIGHVGQLPFSIRVLLENLLRQEDGRFVRTPDIEALAEWQPKAATRSEIAFMPARVLLQDFTGVPAVADLAAMRDAMSRMGGDPKKINPLLPAELVIDHSVQVDKFGGADAFAFNAEWNSTATWSVTNSCAGDKRLFRISRWSRRIPASCTR